MKMDSRCAFIGGGWVVAQQPQWLPVTNPATEEIVAKVAAASLADVEAAMRSAGAAYELWSQTTWQDRSELISAVADTLAANAESLAQTVTEEMGQPIRLAQRDQIDTAVMHLRVISEELANIQWSESVGTAQIVREAAGVVVAITPWNAPLLQVCVKIGAAIAAGCSVVLKPSEFTPLTAYRMMELVGEILPPGVLNLVSGRGVDIGRALVEHERTDVVSLTGSVRAGQEVMKSASRGLKRVSLELGGKSPSLVMDAGSLEAAVRGTVQDGFRNAGQVCAGLTRLIVPRALAQEAGEIAAAEASTFVVGNPQSMTSDLGPIVTEAQFERVRTLIRSGLEEGADLLVGGPELPHGLERGYFIRPTVFGSVSPGMRVFREEIFGPVIVVVPSDDESDAIEIANDSDFGLAAAVWSEDLDQAARVAKRLRVGRVRVNGGPLNPRAPHGGVKLSGIGREWGRVGIEEFLEYKSILW